MMLGVLRLSVGRIVDRLQAVLGYIELKEYDKAHKYAFEAAKEAQALVQVVSGMAVIVPSSDVKAVVLDTPVTVVPLDKVGEATELNEVEKKQLEGIPKEGKIAVVPKKPPSRETL